MAAVNARGVDYPNTHWRGPSYRICGGGRHAIPAVLPKAIIKVMLFFFLVVVLAGIVVFGFLASPSATSSANADLLLDTSDEATIEAAAKEVEARGSVDLVFVATGTLHTDQFSPEKSLSALSADAMAHLYQINAIGPAMVAKHFLPLLSKRRKAVFAALCLDAAQQSAHPDFGEPAQSTWS